MGSKKKDMKMSPSMPVLKRVQSTQKEDSPKPFRKFSESNTIESVLNLMKLDQYKEIFQKDGIEINSSFIHLSEDSIQKNVKNIFHRNRMLMMIIELENEMNNQEKEFKEFIEKYNLNEYSEQLISMGYDDIYFLRKLTEKEIQKLNVPKLYLYLKEIEFDEEEMKYYDIHLWLKSIGFQKYQHFFNGTVNMLDLFQLNDEDINELLKTLPIGYIPKFKMRLNEQKQIWLKK